MNLNDFGAANSSPLVHDKGMIKEEEEKKEEDDDEENKSNI